jgi:hypothetical protein
MLNKIGLVIPTHWSKKGFRNGSWGPPTTGWIEKTVNSLHKRCPDAGMIETTVVLNYHDGSLQYKDALRKYCDDRRFTFRMDPSAGFRGVRLNMCDWFKKDYLFLCEHDWEWKVDLSLEDIVRTFEEHDHVNYIRFNKRANQPKQVLTATKRVGGDLYLIKDDRVNINILHTPQYSNTPHIERMSKYREWCKNVEANPVHAGGNGGAGGFEHPLQEKSLDDLEKFGIEERNRLWGTYIYGKMGDPMSVEHFGI